MDGSGLGIEAFKVGAELARRYLGRSDVATCLSLIRSEMERDARIAVADREEVARICEEHTRVDPSMLGALRTFLSDGDEAILPLMRTRMQELLDSNQRSFEDSPAELADLYVEHLGSNAYRAFQDDRDAIHHDIRRVASEFGARRDPSLGIAEPSPVVVFAGDSNLGVRRAISALSDHEPAGLVLIGELIASEDQSSVAAEWAVNPPVALLTASSYVWAVIARYAEKGGNWNQSQLAWKRAAETDPTVDSILNSCVAAELSGQRELSEALFAEAVEIDPDNPRVLLQQATRADNPKDHLSGLDGLTSSDPLVEALIQCFRCQAYLFAEDIDRAEAAAIRAAESDGELMQVKVCAINVDVHRARIAMSMNEVIDTRRLHDIERESLEIRDQLVAQRRFTESGRILMLAMDSANLRGDPDRASQIADQALEEEERASPLVLAEAAIRANLNASAREFASLAPEGDDRELVMAIAGLGLGIASYTSTLDRLVLNADAEIADIAAFQLLFFAAFDRGEWSEPASDRIKERSETDWVALRAMYLAKTQQLEAVEELLASRPDSRAMTELRFRVSVIARTKDRGELAKKVLAANPNHTVRLMASRELVDVGESSRAEAEARVLAENPYGGVKFRSDAYEVLMRALAKEDRYEEALREIERWARIDPASEALNRWLVRTGNRLARAR